MLLRLYTPEVAKHVFTTMSDDELMAFLGLDSTEALAKEKEKFSLGIATYNRSFANFQMIDKETGKHIGACGFHTWVPDHRRAEIGYALDNDAYKQKGLMSEALYAILKYGFNEMNLHRIEALVAEWNTASVKLLTKFGFQKEGVLRQHYVVNDIPEDSVAYSLLKPEFRF
ncbi:GNAT family N-acetyltransferase [Flavobacterium suzhouense]|uniref:GNAT family N-acetyltransferase n=1 Tax=Flavobacterium suzhouense TaxID=1529638 RepID=A0ABW5NXL4_9FLAO